MVYNVPGITYGDVEGMPPWERKAFLELLLKQRKLEKEHHEQMTSNSLDKPQDGFKTGRNDLLRTPVSGEVHGSKDPRDKIRGGKPAKFIPGPKSKDARKIPNTGLENKPSQSK